jgi:hypothetical protein
VDTSPTLTDCFWVLRTALGVVRGTQRFPNYTQWKLLSHSRVVTEVTSSWHVARFVTSPSPCARLPHHSSPAEIVA